MIRLGLSYQKLSHIFISHLHGDHFLGLFPLLNTMNLQNRENDITVVAPKGLKKVIDALVDVSDTEFRFMINFIELDETMDQINLENVNVSPFILKHRIPCYGFRFEEHAHPRKLRVDQCRYYNIPVRDYESVVDGNDWVSEDGTVIANDKLTEDPPSAASYVYITDTLYSNEWCSKAMNASLLYHEATYLDNLVDKAHDRYHTTAKEAAIFATEANVKQLIIGHFSGKYKDLEGHLKEARSIFPNSDLAEQERVFEFK